MIDLEKIRIEKLEPESNRCCFDCGDDDLNEFYKEDSINIHRELIAISYAVKHGDDTLCFFSVSNDSLVKRLINKNIFDKIFQNIHPDKIYSTTPAVKIGRLATDKTYHGQGVGTKVLDMIKYSFTFSNKTGCRFVIVDAYNNEDTTNFYKKNGFDFLSEKDKNRHTRSMYFDLKIFKYSI